MFYLEVIIAFSLFWAIGGLIFGLVYMGVKNRDDKEPTTHCCAEEGHCECNDKLSAYVEKRTVMPRAEVLPSTLTRFPDACVPTCWTTEPIKQTGSCGYAPPKEEEQG